jgi:hypothetical protein
VIGGHSVSEEDANEAMDRVNRLAGAPERNRGFKTQVRYIAYALWMMLYFGDAPRERRRGTRRDLWRPDADSGGRRRTMPTLRSWECGRSSLTTKREPIRAE